jgi:hypothetical protein
MLVVLVSWLGMLVASWVSAAYLLLGLVFDFSLVVGSFLV